MIEKKMVNYYHTNLFNKTNQNLNPSILLNQRIDQYLIKKNIISDDELTELYNNTLNLHQDKINYFSINKNVIKKVTIDWMLKYNIIPFDETSKVVKILIDDPLDIERILLVESLFKKGVEVFYKNKEEIQYLIGMQSMNIDISKKKDDLKIDKLIDSIVMLAFEYKASDMHFDINDHNVKLNYRIDGTIVELMNIDLEVYHQLLTKIKILSNMDVTITLYPQDGHFLYNKKKIKVDIRTSTIPTIDGERLALRFLNENKELYSLDKLGMLDFQEDVLKKSLNGSGIILVTGPTGSGKTTTLYAILDYLKKQNKNIMTIEDPIEIRMDGITQIPLQMMDYPQILKSIVRQDPDILMLGEIRDSETASMVVKLAQTGHLIIATIHSSTSSGVIARLINFGIPKYLIEDTVKLVISQRLIRKKCSCEGGCSKCFFTGYSGRQLIAEQLYFDKEVKRLLYHENYQALIEEYCNNQFFGSISKIYLAENKVSKEELVRVGLM